MLDRDLVLEGGQLLGQVPVWKDEEIQFYRLVFTTWKTIIESKRAKIPWYKLNKSLTFIFAFSFAFLKIQISQIMCEIYSYWIQFRPS